MRFGRSPPMRRSKTGTPRSDRDRRAPPASSPYTAIHAKVNGRWLMASVQEPIAGQSASEDPLDSLDWLVGSWHAEQNGGKMHVTFRWVANRNFLERVYSVEQGGRITSSGVQLIGQDPTSRELQSWSFTSDAGFAVGDWIAQPEGWEIVTRGKLPDGTTTSAVNYLTRLDENSLSWQWRAEGGRRFAARHRRQCADAHQFLAVNRLPLAALWQSISNHSIDRSEREIMSKRFLILTASVWHRWPRAGTGWARGFGGGFHGGGGGFRGGDFGGDRGEFRGDDFRGDDFARCRWLGRRPLQRRGLWRRPFRRDRAAGYSNFNRGAAAPTRGDLNRFLGLPSDEGFHPLAGGARRASPAERPMDRAD